ncbi:MAG TPA: hypothetical protein VNS10_14830 [Gemmatimonadaceae bacterium]|jgi:hypothetical protein|nr:hypothetical protein [Gemmatimonadaceae bacterium]
MDTYHIALFLHIVALIVAASATAVTKLAVGRRIRARTIGESLEWLNVQISASAAFPITLAAFVITGSYMVSKGGPHAWASGFVVSGLVGVAFLLASGTYLGIKGKALKQVLEGMAKAGADRPAPHMAPPKLVAVLPLANTGVALGVVFDMAAKPASIALALGIVAAGAAITVGLSRLRKSTRVVQSTVVERA